LTPSQLFPTAKNLKFLGVLRILAAKTPFANTITEVHCFPCFRGILKVGQWEIR